MNLTPALHLAAEQHGAVADRQLRDLGISARQQRRAVTAGFLLPAAPGVTVVAGSADTWHRRLQIGLLALGPDAFVSHEAAAALLGLDRCCNAVEFTICRRRGGITLPGATVHTSTSIGPLT